VWELVELIAASANERLLRDPDADVRAVWRVIERYPAAGRFHYEYWAGLENASEFPLSVWLRDQTPY
jgi:hypothetical protein